jgi:hypothetical protein
LEGFLDSRGEEYSREMSSPLTVFESCARLSPHLAHARDRAANALPTPLRARACGDWTHGSRIEGAYLSGTALAGRVLNMFVDAWHDAG